MSQLNFPSEDPLLRQAHESLAATEVPPGPSSDLIRRVNDQMLECAPIVSRDNSQRKRRRTYYAAAAVVFFAVIGLAILSPGLGNRVLADVVQQLEDLKSGKARLTKSVDGIEVESTKVLFKGKSLKRMEMSSGDIDVVNVQRGEHTRLMSAEKKAVVEAADALPDGEDPISQLKRIASQPMSRIADRTIDGASHALGFSRQESGRTETIWVDPKTRLPIRGESTFKDAQGRTVTLTLDELEYNIDIEDSLFEIGVPESYTLIDRRSGQVDVTTATIEALEQVLKNPDLADLHDAIRKDIERMKQSEPSE